MPYNLRRRYNLRERRQPQPPTRQTVPPKSRAVKRSNSTRRGPRRNRQTQNHKDISAVSQNQEQQQQQSSQSSRSIDMENRLKALGYEEVAFIPGDFGEYETQHEPTLEECDPQALLYTWPLETMFEIDQTTRENHKGNVFVEGLIRTHDNMRERMRRLEAENRL